MVAPLILKIVAFSIAKKVVVFLVAKLYGFPRLYRRVSEFNHYINRNNPKRRERFQNRLQFLFRLPSHIYETVQRWRGVQPPQGPPSSAAHSHGSTSSHSQHNEVREVHTRSGSSRAISSLNVPNPTSSLSGFGSITQSIRSHLLGLRGVSRTSKARLFPVSCALPFGDSSLVSSKVESERSLKGSSEHFSTAGVIDSHVASIKMSLQDSRSEYLQTTPELGPSVESCPAQEAPGESPFRSVSETVVSTIDESKISTPKSVGLSLIL